HCDNVPIPRSSCPPSAPLLPPDCRTTRSRAAGAYPDCRIARESGATDWRLDATDQRFGAMERCLATSQRDEAPIFRNLVASSRSIATRDREFAPDDGPRRAFELEIAPARRDN